MTRARGRSMGIALLGLMFIAGLVIGAAAMRAYILRILSEELATRMHQPFNVQSTRGTGLGDLVGRNGAIPRAYSALDLTDEQRRQMSLIITSATPQADSIIGPVIPHLRALTDSINAALQAVLTPAQRAKFDAGLKRRGQ